MADEEAATAQQAVTANELVIQRAEEELRQARETFAIRKAHDRAWRTARLTVSYTSVFIIIAVMVMAMWIMLNHPSFPTSIQTAAISAFFVDLLSTVVLVWKLIFRFDSEVPSVAPVLP
jgi:hypothetical protein